MHLKAHRRIRKDIDDGNGKGRAKAVNRGDGSGGCSRDVTRDSINNQGGDGEQRRAAERKQNLPRKWAIFRCYQCNTLETTQINRFVILMARYRPLF